MSLVEDLAYFIWFLLWAFLLSYGAKAVAKVRLWDLGTRGKIGRLDRLDSSCMALGASLCLFNRERLGFFALIAILTVVLCYVYSRALAKPPLELETQPLIGEAAERLRELGARHPLTANRAFFPEYLIVEYGSPDELLRWLDKRAALVIPKGFAEVASQAEIEALGARQLLRTNPWLIFLGSVPAVISAGVGVWAKIHSRPDIAVFAGIVSFAAMVWMLRWALRHEDRRLDREAVVLTKYPAAYIQALERVDRTLPRTGNLPGWFGRDSIEARSAAIRNLGE